MRFEVDYYNDNGAVRTKIVEAANEVMVPFELHRLDKHFSKVKKVKVIEEQPAVNP